jgi:hypothetical protein
MFFSACLLLGECRFHTFILQMESLALFPGGGECLSVFCVQG